MAQRRHGHKGLDVVGDHVVAPLQSGAGAGGQSEHGAGARARAGLQVGRFTRRSDQSHGIIHHLVGQAHGTHGRHGGGDVVRAGDRLDAERGRIGRAGPHAMARDDGAFFLERGIAQGVLEQKAIELGFGKRIDALLFDRILSGDHGETIAQPLRYTIDGDPALLHRLQQGSPGSWAGYG